MQCTLCHEGRTEPGRVSLTLERDGVFVIIKEVPAHVCNICGEEYLEEDVTRNAYGLAAQVPKSGAAVEIIEYAA